MDKKQKGILIMIVCFVALMVAASLLYGKLGDKVETQLLAEGPQEQVTVPQEALPEESKAEDTAETDEAEKSEYAAPDFTVYDKDGNPVKLSDFKGKPVVLNFWASWCDICKEGLPDFNQVFLEYDGTVDVEFMIVNLTDGVQETKEKAAQYIEEQGFAFPAYYDSDMEATMTYGVWSVPVTYFINEDGDLVTYVKGGIGAEILKKGIEICMTTVIE